jgi:hypothetical protein
MSCVSLYTKVYFRALLNMILFIDILLINGQFEDAFLLAVHPGMYMYV